VLESDGLREIQPTACGNIQGTCCAVFAAFSHQNYSGRGRVWLQAAIIRLVYWPVLLGVFVAGFVLEYRRISRRRSILRGGVAP